jgi:hypothetical protein
MFTHKEEADNLISGFLKVLGSPEIDKHESDGIVYSADVYEQAKKCAILCWKKIRDDRYRKNEYAMTVLDQMNWESVLREIERA